MSQDRREAANPFNNPEYREEFTMALTTALAPISQIVAKHEKDLEVLKASRNRQLGATTLLGIMWTGLLASLEFFFHKKV